MAVRPVFVPDCDGPPYVSEVDVEFRWYSGLSYVQAQRTIQSLHVAAASQGLGPALEISSRSQSSLGAALSAFALSLRGPGNEHMSVECAFQGSKVFERGGPFTDLYQAESRAAKKDARLKSSGRLVGFEYLGNRMPLSPPTAFYDWLYIKALVEHPDVSGLVPTYACFTDIAFNPSKSINCQARSAAVFASLSLSGILPDVNTTIQTYIELVSQRRPSQPLGSLKQLCLDL
jgi:hypothetical protein